MEERAASPAPAGPPARKRAGLAGAELASEAAQGRQAQPQARLRVRLGQSKSE